MQLNPYLTFDGQCETAFRLWRAVCCPESLPVFVQICHVLSL